MAVSNLIGGSDAKTLELAEVLESVATRGWRSQLNAILQAYGWFKENSARGKKVSSKTFQMREMYLFAFFEILWAAGFRILPAGIRKKHLDFLLERWISEGNSPATLQQKLSVLRVFSSWIRKDGLVPGSHILFKGRMHLIQRSYIRTSDPAPESKGIDREEFFDKATAVDSRFGAMMRFEALFGARRRETICFRPHSADKGDYISFCRKEVGAFTGTKNGRPRRVPVETDEQRELLEMLKRLVEHGKALGWCDGQPDGQKKSVNLYKKFARGVGMTKKDLHFTGHDLRATYIVESAEKKGILAPLRGGDGSEVSKEQLLSIRGELAEEAGHARVSITNSYIGAFPKGTKKKAVPKETLVDGDGLPAAWRSPEFWEKIEPCF